MQLMNSITVDDLFLVENSIPIMTRLVGVQVYDFPFRNYFDVKSLLFSPSQPVVARIGAIDNYAEVYSQLQEVGITLVHSPFEHELCSLLPRWYPLLADLTPKSTVYEALPTVQQVEADFGWPVFVKGERQTNRHKKSLSIIENAHQFNTLLTEWKNNPVLHWQHMVCRQFIPLQVVEEVITDRLPSSFEFRCFLWKGQLVSTGRYWYDAPPYELSQLDLLQVTQLVIQVAQRLSVCFLVVDVAKTAQGQWIVIEVNDGQESGYAGNNGRLLWEKIIQMEKSE